MNSKFLNVTTEDLKGALVSASFMAVIAILIYIQDLGSIWLIEWKDLADVAIMSLIVYFISISKNFLTTEEGKFLGIVQWK